MFPIKANPLKIEPAYYTSPINLPEKKSGDISITHRWVQDSTPIIGQRQAILRGVRPVSLKLNEGHKLCVHELRSKKHGLWMTDLPEELFQIAEMLATVKPKGNVLIGGLGLGILAKTVALREKVTGVTVVEHDRNVIKLCANPELYITFQADILKFLTQNPFPFDYYLLDTWQGTNELAWWDTVLPLRRAIRNQWGSAPKIHCWAEDIMQGQVARRLADNSHPHWYYKNLPPSMTVRQIDYFFNHAGEQKWEEKYGKLIPENP